MFKTSLTYISVHLLHHLQWIKSTHILDEKLLQLLAPQLVFWGAFGFILDVLPTIPTWNITFLQ